mgnify:CR=1 FL=1|jgi:thiosulfate/3-mercaptopyruvate sulfurtransferase
MRTIPSVVDSAWLYERLDNPHLRLIDATTFLRIPNKDGETPGLWSG